MRTYESSHSWINFTFEVSKIPPETWVRLGQVQAKCESISGIPLMPSVARNLHRIFLAKGALATTAIEGNTLTENDVLSLIQGNLELPPSKEYLAKEVDNILSATRVIMDRILHDAPTELRPEEIKEYNRMVLNELPLADQVKLGEYRNYDVRVATYMGAPPEDLSYLIESMCNWLNSEFNVSGQLKFAFGILKAIVAHVYMAWIHPFGDGNGRTARLIESQILLAVGAPTPATHLLSNYYNQTRAEYYRYLDIASRYEDGIYLFVDYAMQGFVDSLDEQIRMIEVQQLAVHWQNYIYAQFRNRDSKADIRRRRLVLDLSAKIEGKPITLSETRHISPRIAEAYAGKTDKTIQRDINLLIQMGLIEKTREGIRARTEIMRAFLPQKRDYSSNELTQVTRRRPAGHDG